MDKYVLYARKSSESEERQVKSLDAQETEMLRIAHAEQLHVVDIVRESHSAKITGARPLFNQILKGIRSGKYDAILTWAPDRISRNAGDLGQIIDLMDAGKIVRVRTYAQTFENDPYSKFMLMMLGSQAKLENDQKSLNVKRGNREKLKRGDWINTAPFGYLNDKATKTIVVDPVRSPYVVNMFELYATGLYSFKQIADLLYEKGLRTRSGKKVHKSLIQIVLRKPFYYGVMEADGKYYVGNHTPLITKELFDECQIIANGNARPRAKTKGFTLSGFITCHKCGCAITAEIKKGKYIYYHCTNGKGVCDQKSYNANEGTLHEQIADKLKEIKISDRMIDIAYKAKLEELAQTDTYDNHALDAARGALGSLTTRKSRLVDTYTAGDIDETLYRQKLLELNNETVGLTKQIEEMEKDEMDPRATIELVYNKFKRGNTIANRYSEVEPEEKREMLSEALSNSTLLDRNIATLSYKSPFSHMAKVPENVDLCTLLPG